MNIITIAREFGAGGREVACRLAEALGWELLDRELLHRAAQSQHVPDAELERLDEKAIGMADRLRLHPPHQQYLHGLQAAAQQAAQRGNVVLVGRGARHLLGPQPGAFHLRLVAPQPWRANRMARLEGWSTEQALARCTAVDRTRDRFTRYFFGDHANRPAEYDAVVNTALVPLEDVAAVLAALVRGEAPAAAGPSTGRRVLTLARHLGAGQQGLPLALGQRLAMRVCDRDLLEQEAVRLGVTESRLEKLDQRPAGIFQRLLRPGGISQRYIEVLEQLVQERAQQGEVILVGRGGSRILRADPRAFHVKLVAPLEVRVRRVMEYHWVGEDVARKLIAQSDAQRQSFYSSYFGADWNSPLEYHLTVNSGRLGPAAVDLLDQAARRHWGGPPAVAPPPGP